jgi:hypothetical protein
MIASIAMTAVGTGLGAMGTIASGQARADAATAQARNEATIRDWQAKQMEVQGDEEQALAQRRGQELEKQKRFALSRLQARSAASGFTATDPTTLSLAEDIEEYGTYQQQMADYGGAVKRKDLELGAAGQRYSGLMGVNMANQYASDVKASSYLDASGTIAQGAGSIFAKYAPSKMPGGVTYGNYGGIQYPIFGSRYG